MVNIKTLAKARYNNIKMIMDNGDIIEGYFREILQPEEDEENQNPVAVIEEDDVPKGSINGYYVNEIESIEILD